MKPRFQCVLAHWKSSFMAFVHRHYDVHHGFHGVNRRFVDVRPAIPSDSRPSSLDDLARSANRA